MAYFVSALGVVILVLGVVGLLMPLELAKRMSGWREGSRVWWAVGARTVLGVLLLLAAETCRQPAVIRVLGVIALASAVAFALMGPRRFGAFVGWWLDRPPQVMRAWMVLVVLFGGLLIWSGA